MQTDALGRHQDGETLYGAVSERQGDTPQPDSFPPKPSKMWAMERSKFNLITVLWAALPGQGLKTGSC